MHCELLVPGLFAAAGEAQRVEAREARRPAAELLLARGRASEDEAQSLERWLAERFGAGDAPLAAGALTLAAHGRAAGAAIWARADPVHLQLLRDRVALVPAEAFALSREEADALCATLNAHFTGTHEFMALEPTRWCVRLAQPADLPGDPPLERAGRDVVPRGAADALANEIQMALHEHPVNEAREARGEPAVNGLWLWGAGAAPGPLQAPWQSVNADDPLARGLAQAAALRARPLAASAGALLERAPEDGRHLVVLDRLRIALALGDPEAASRALAALEAQWFAPLLAALRAGRIGMLSVHVPDAGMSIETIRGDLRRFWRRPRPLARMAP